MLHRQCRWPLSNVRVCLNLLEIKLETIREDFQKEEVAALEQYCRFLMSKELSTVEKVTVAIERLFVKYCRGSNSERYGVFLSKIVGYSVWLLYRLDPYFKQELHRRALSISYFFKEPEKKALGLLQRQHLNRYRQVLSRERLYSGGVAQGAGYAWPEREAYRRYIKGSEQSRILLGVHLGDFIDAYLHIGRESHENWSVLVPRREEADGDALANTALSSNLTLLHANKYSPAAMATRLRNGRHTLAIMADLHSGFGETVPVRFLGQSARFVKGPACIALLSACPVIPFVSFHQDKQNHIVMSEVIHPTVHSGETFSDAVSRLTQKFATFCEHWVKRYPEQWKFLAEANLFLDKSLMRSKPAKGGEC
ncbi:MAG: hypothetical protein R3332_11505 [Pseudohongiellaceae bacterium]|nr:hypothetical protein [Pseudohongiellaceae bacterium]